MLKFYFKKRVLQIKNIKMSRCEIFDDFLIKINTIFIQNVYVPNNKLAEIQKNYIYTPI